MESVESVVATRVRQAFPSALRLDVEVVLGALPLRPNLPSGDNLGTVVVQGESLRIPSRVYLPEPEPLQLRALTANQQLIVHCLFTRHHDGHVRERMLRRALPHCTAWTVPFFVQLLGEYVVEIVDVLEKGIRPEHEQLYAEFLMQNPLFWGRTCQRVISYWHCYYRREFPNRQNYPGTRLVVQLEKWRSTSLSRNPSMLGAGE